MKAALLALPLAAAACLSSPSGLPPLDGAAIDAAASIDATPDAVATTWPPAGLAVTAIAAGDLDADGRDALIVAAEGVVYLIDDADLPADAAVTDFTTFAPLPGATAPIAIELVDVDGGGGLDVVVAYVEDTAVKVTAFSGTDLAPLGTHTVAGVVAPPATASAWMDPVTFPSGMVHLVVAMGNEIRHARVAELDDPSTTFNLIPPPVAAWSAPQLAAGYGEAVQRIVIAQPDEAHHSHIPTSPPPGDMFVWTETRSGTAWLGQLARDLTSDGVPEVLGYDPGGGTPSRVCADQVEELDPQVCMNTTLDHADDVAMVLDTFTTPAGPDLMVVHAGATTADVTLFPDVNYDAIGAILSSDPPFSTSVTLPRARATAASLGQSNHVLLLVGVDGTIACRRETPGQLVPCT